MLVAVALGVVVALGLGVLVGSGIVVLVTEAVTVTVGSGVGVEITGVREGSSAMAVESVVGVGVLVTSTVGVARGTPSLLHAATNKSTPIIHTQRFIMTHFLQPNEKAEARPLRLYYDIH